MQSSPANLLIICLRLTVKQSCWGVSSFADMQYFGRCRFLIQILPAAVVAPLYFQGKIGFGVINQSSSAFNHILSDVSLVVYQVCPQKLALEQPAVLVLVIVYQLSLSYCQYTLPAGYVTALTR